MSIWGRLASATTDSSPGSTLIGAFFGGGSGQPSPAQGHAPSDDNALPFTLGMITLGAKMAQADGVVTRDEVQAFKNAFRVSPAEMKHAARAFNLAKQDTSGFENNADELVTVFKGDRKLLEYTLDGLFHIAKADGDVPAAELSFLAQVAKRFGFTDAEFATMKARHLGAAERTPYEVLGVAPSVSDAELKRSYERLAAESQSEAFLSLGMPLEFEVICKAKLAAVEAAYATIAKERKL
jgi:DnaJ like chaperone protein